MYDVVLIGGGIMSATIGTLIHLLEPTWSIVIFERLPQVAQESSDPWNNAGTGHAAYCELNYTPLDPSVEERSVSKPRIDTTKAVKVNSEFQTSRKFWDYLSAQGIINQNEFLTQVPHLTFVTGTADVEFLKARYEALKQIPAFHAMEFSDDPTEIAEWVPLIIEGRATEPVAATRVLEGTDIDFGNLTNQLFNGLTNSGAELHTNTEVISLSRNTGPWFRRGSTQGFRDADGVDSSTDWCWEISYVNKDTNQTDKIKANFVFVGAGGGTLPLLQKANLKEINGYAGFPISGQFLKCTNKDIIKKHHAKVYAKAAIGAPPMSVPHLDTRIIDGDKQLVFGPYAGFSPKFLKHGLNLGLITSLRIHNLIPMLWAGISNASLTKYLVKEVFSTPAKRLAALRELFPEAKAKDWELITAGQRVQIIKPDPETKRGTLAFGTEVVTSKDGTIAGVLGASPGASTAAAIALETLHRCFPTQSKTWKPTLQKITS